MGIFGSYTKEGPGVPENEPKKTGIALFGEILGRKFFNLLSANIIYFLISAPFFLLIMFFVSPQISNLLLGDTIVKSDPGMKLWVDLLIAELVLVYFGSGPASASYSFISKSYIQSKPIWMLSDGFDKFKENFKQAMCLIVIDTIILIAVFADLRFYVLSENIISTILCAVVIAAFFLYSTAHIFMYQLMITYNCKLRDIIKNAIILTIANLPKCMLLLVTTIVFILLLSFTAWGYISVIVYATVGLSLMKFPLEFFAAEVIENNLLKRSIDTQIDA